MRETQFEGSMEDCDRLSRKYSLAHRVFDTGAAC